MKKEVILFSILFLILVAVFFISAAVNDVPQKAYECLQGKLDEIGCSGLSLEENIFSLLSMGQCKDELLALSKTENTKKCFGTGTPCDLKQTSQAIIALKMEGSDTTNHTSWLLSQTSTPTGVDWFLQIDIVDSSAATCTIITSDSSYQVSIGTNQKLTTSSGSSSCFSIDSNEYWIKINLNCYDKQFNISCDKDFSTTLLFRKTGSSVIHLLDNTQFASGGKNITEKVNSNCFKKDGSCNYEGTLWAALALELAEEDTSSYLPYLIVMAEDNSKHLPESFLYYLTSEDSFSVSLKTKQKQGGYWNESGNEFYDSAVALFPFQNKDFQEKTNTINWLKNIQNNNGCFGDANFKDTAFLLYSVWPKLSLPPSPALGCTKNSDCPIESCKIPSCDVGGSVCLDVFVACQNGDGCCPPGCTFQRDNDCGEGQECTTSSSCDVYDNNSSDYCLNNSVYKYIYDYSCVDGNCIVNETNNFIKNCSSNESCNKGVCVPKPECVKNNDCSGNKICKNGSCISPTEKSSCEDNNGYCMSRASCHDAEGEILTEYSCLGLNFCCDKEEQETTDEDIGGVEPAGSSSCEGNQGICRNSCNEDEKKSDFYNCGYGKICCMPKKEKSNALLLIIILIILIILAAMAIIFRKKLSGIFRRKPSAEKKPSLFPGLTPRKPGMPSGAPLRRPIPRRILPQRKIRAPPEKEKPRAESEDIFKKLKELGK